MHIVDDFCAHARHNNAANSEWFQLGLRLPPVLIPQWLCHVPALAAAIVKYLAGLHEAIGYDLHPEVGPTMRLP